MNVRILNRYSITLNTYSHVAPGLQEAAATRFDEAFSNRYNNSENEAIEKRYWQIIGKNGNNAVMLTIWGHF